MATKKTVQEKKMQERKVNQLEKVEINQATLDKNNELLSDFKEDLRDTMREYNKRVQDVEYSLLLIGQQLHEQNAKLETLKWIGAANIVGIVLTIAILYLGVR